MESLLLLIYNLQEVCVLAIVQEPLAHAKLDVKDCRDCDKSIQVSRLARGSIGNGTFFLSILYPFQAPNLSWFWSHQKKKEVLSAKNCMFCHV